MSQISAQWVQKKKLFYSHNIQKTTHAIRPQEITTAPSLHTKDFPNLPTIRPVVWSQVEAQNIPSKEMYSLSQEDQNQIMKITAKAVEAQGKKMFPEIMATILAAMQQKTSN